MRVLLVLLFVVLCVGYVLRVEKRMALIALEVGMADVNIVEGDSSLGRPQVLEWRSNGQTIKLSVYKATANETAEEWTERLTAYIGQYQAAGQYPPET